MSKSRIGVFTPEDAARIHQAVLGRSSVQPDLNVQRKYTTRKLNYYVKMLAALPAATDPETGYTQAMGLVVRYEQPVDPESLNMEPAEDVAENKIQVTNRSTSFSASINDYIWVQDMGSEYAPLHSGGGQNNAGDECGCDCEEEGNLTVNGVETMRTMRVSFPQLCFKQTNGKICLPAGNYLLVWDSNQNKWRLDIGDLLVAYYNDGTSATLQTTMDGEITLTFPSTGKPTLKLCVDGTVPVPEFNDGISTGFSYGLDNGFIDGYANAPYDDRVIFAGSTGTASGTGIYQQFGTGTYLAPGTGTYGENTGTGTGTGTFMWSDYEEGFYQGYKSGYATGYKEGQRQIAGTGTAPGTGTSPGAGTGVGGP